MAASSGATALRQDKIEKQKESPPIELTGPGSEGFVEVLSHEMPIIYVPRISISIYREINARLYLPIG